MNSGMQLREEIFGSERTEQEALQMILRDTGNVCKLHEAVRTSETGSAGFLHGKMWIKFDL